MSIPRQGSSRSDRRRIERRLLCKPDVLEARRVLQAGIPTYQSPWIPSDLLVTNPITKERELFIARDQVNPYNFNSQGFNNAGKVVSGTDRAGDKWVITVHGPGRVIVTDTTPNDGVLDDDINTIQLVNTNAKKTYVTGNVIPSNVNVTSGEIIFNQLVAVSPVKSIELNGFDLSNQVSPAVTTPTGVFLYGGVGTLSFNSIDAQIDTSVNPAPFPIQIGLPNTPLKQQPSIFLNNITNLVFNSTSTTIPTAPLTTPTVQFTIQGVRAQLRHRLGHAGFDPGWIPVRVPAGRHDRSDSRSSDGRQHPERSRFRQELHGLASAYALLGRGERRELHQEGPFRRQCRRGRPRRERQDRQAVVQSRAGKSGGRLHGQVRLDRAVAAFDDLRDAAGHDRVSRPPVLRVERSAPRASAS